MRLVGPGHPYETSKFDVPVCNEIARDSFINVDNNVAVEQATLYSMRGIVSERKRISAKCTLGAT